MYGILNSNASIGITINIIDIEAIKITAFLKKIFSSSSTDITKLKNLRLINLLVVVFCELIKKLQST